MAVETIGADTTNTRGTVLTAGSANTKGSYVELSASVSTTCSAVAVAIFSANQNVDYLVDIATGAASAETDLIANIQTNRPTTAVAVRYFVFPIAITSGTRVSARCQASTGAATCRVVMYLFSGTSNFLGGTGAVNYGANAADSGGTSIDPGGSANTKGAYTEITASTSSDIKWVTVMLGNQTNAARASAEFLLDIATGSAGSESVVLNNVYFVTTSTGSTITAVGVSFPVTIASGTRIAARAQCTIIDATDRLFDIVLMGDDSSAGGAVSGGPTFSAFIG